MENSQDLTRERFRADAYRFLSACFYLPQKELFIQENIFKTLTNALTHTCPEAALFSSEMEKAFSETDEEELKVEYARLFVGPYELKAPPYGSIYLDGERRVMGNSTMEVIRLYEEAGLVIDKDFKDLPDHIAVELEFMYFLAHETGNALEKSDLDRVRRLQEIQSVFLNKYLRKWALEFCHKISTNTDNTFYVALAGCVSTFLSLLTEPENIRCFPGGKPCDLSMN